ncbi:MAG: efflux RND transporter periplasmic adaptor subunit [Gammaproteobacteria bacterium]
MDRSALLDELRIQRGVTPPPASGRRRAIAIVLLAALAALAAWQIGAARAIAVRTAIAQPLAAAPASAPVLDAAGYVTARRKATVSARITGRIAEVLIEEGQRVEAGQVLARLDPTTAQAQHDLARAQLDAERARIRELQIQLDQARRDLHRARELLPRRLASEQAVENAATAVAGLEAGIATQASRVGIAERNLELAAVGVDDTVVRAPFAGVVTDKAAQPGEIVSPMSAGGGYTRTGIGTIVDMDSLEVEVEVNEAYIGRVRRGQTVQITLNAYPQWKIPGRVIAPIPAADRSKATVEVRIGFDVRDPRVVPDMGARVAFLDGDHAATAGAPLPGVLVPAAAVRDEGGRASVFVAADGRAQVRAVQIGQAFGDARQVLSGVATGERVILAPPDDLQSGDAVVEEGGR